jgi:hypothetical protein
MEPSTIFVIVLLSAITLTYLFQRGYKNHVNKEGKCDL